MGAAIQIPWGFWSIDLTTKSWLLNGATETKFGQRGWSGADWQLIVNLSIKQTVKYSKLQHVIENDNTYQDHGLPFQKIF